MKPIIVIAATGILCGCTAMGPSPQTEETRPAEPVHPAEPGRPAPPQPVEPVLPGLPVAGKTPLGVTVVEMEAIIVGWSAKRDLLGNTVLNENSERIGRIDDLIIAPDSAVSYAIIGVGGFLGVARHDVAIPMSQIKLSQGRLILPGATREALKALPPFEYRRM